MRFPSPLTYRPAMFLRLAQVMKNWNNDPPKMPYYAYIGVSFPFRRIPPLNTFNAVNAPLKPLTAANNSIRSTHNTYEYHATFIGFIAAHKAAPF